MNLKNPSVMCINAHMDSRTIIKMLEKDECRNRKMGTGRNDAIVSKKIDEINMNAEFGPAVVRLKIDRFS